MVGTNGGEAPGGSVTLDRVGGAAVLRVSGALDLALAPKLQQLVERAVRLGPAVLVIDLTDVQFLASAGMSVLLRTQRECPPGTALRIVAQSRIVLRPMELTRLTDEFDVFPTLATALDGG